MMERFQQLAPRERIVLVVGAALALVIVGWTFVWSPLRDGVSERNSAVAEKSVEVVNLRRAAGLSAPSGNTVVVDAPNLQFLIDETARPYGLGSALQRRVQDGPDAINVYFTEARFDQLVNWLIELDQVYRLPAVSASFTRSGREGLVSGQVRLDRS